MSESTADRDEVGREADSPTERAIRVALADWWDDDDVATGGADGLIARLAGLMKPHAVTPAAIVEQRAKGWPDFHPEDYCHRCGGRNVPSWHADSDRWNAAVASDPKGIVTILCPGCFVVAHEAATGLRASWRLVIDTPFRPIEVEVPS